MYTKQEASALKQKFWISFGKYMSPIPSASAEKINWVNYRTGIKGIQFKMDANNEEAIIFIEISHKEDSIQELFFNHFKTFKKPLEEILEEKWNWKLGIVNESGNTVSCISYSLEKVNVCNESDWPKLISFFKIRMIALDKFWNDYRDIFEMLN